MSMTPPQVAKLIEDHGKFLLSQMQKPEEPIRWSSTCVYRWLVDGCPVRALNFKFYTFFYFFIGLFLFQILIPPGRSKTTLWGRLAGQQIKDEQRALSLNGVPE
jgi:hypothetical protein